MSIFKNVSDHTACLLGDLSIDQIQHEASLKHYQCWVISCANAHSKSQVLSTIAQALHFPAHTGKNFDALSDVLTDMVCDAEGMVIIVNQLPVAPHFSLQDQEVLIDVFSDTMAYFKEQKIPYFIFYQFNH